MKDIQWISNVPETSSVPGSAIINTSLIAFLWSTVKPDKSKEYEPSYSPVPVTLTSMFATLMIISFPSGTRTPKFNVLKLPNLPTTFVFNAG